jgi:hypothetical protein
LLKPHRRRDDHPKDDIAGATDAEERSADTDGESGVQGIDIEALLEAIATDALSQPCAANTTVPMNSASMTAYALINTSAIATAVPRTAGGTRFPVR